MKSVGHSSLRLLTPADLRSIFDAFALLETGVSVCLLPFKNQKPEIEDIPLSSPALGFYSSGTTGTPKICWRAWADLKTEIRNAPEYAKWTWASSFVPCSFAGVQAALQAWAAGGDILSLDSAMEENWNLLASRLIHAVSCTPTFLDLLLQHRSSAHASWNPRQITLGGEPLRPVTGGRFQKAFPQTRFTIIYASAELGVLLKTHRMDGWFELASLEKRFPKWRIDHDELAVWTGNSWQATRDLVELNNDLLRVIGRADAVANVAGSKVSLDEVARLAEQVPGVRRALAFAESNSVSGQIVALRFTPEDGLGGREVRERLEIHLRERLRKEAWPRRWEIGPIHLGPNTKRSHEPGKPTTH